MPPNSSYEFTFSFPLLRAVNVFELKSWCINWEKFPKSEFSFLLFQNGFMSISTERLRLWPFMKYRHLHVLFWAFLKMQVRSRRLTVGENAGETKLSGKQKHRKGEHRINNGQSFHNHNCEQMDILIKILKERMERGLEGLYWGTIYQHHRDRTNHIFQKSFGGLEAAVNTSRWAGSRGIEDMGWIEVKLQPLNHLGTDPLLSTSIAMSLGSEWRRRCIPAQVWSQGSTQRHDQMWSGDTIPPDGASGLTGKLECEQVVEKYLFW